MRLVLYRADWRTVHCRKRRGCTAEICEALPSASAHELDRSRADPASNKAHFVRDFPVRQTFRYKPATVSSRFESRFARPERLAGSSVSSGQALRANSRDAHYWLALDAPRGCTSRAFRAAAGVTGVIALAYIIFPGSAVGVAGYALAWSLLGACTGFLIFNFLPPPQKYLWATQATRCSASRRIPRPGFHRGKRRRQRFARTGISPAGCGAVALTQFWGFCGRQDGPEASGGYLHLLTALLAGVGWLATTGNFKQTMTIGIGPAAALLRAALWLGSLRSRPPEPPSHRAGV